MRLTNLHTPLGFSVLEVVLILVSIVIFGAVTVHLLTRSEDEELPYSGYTVEDLQEVDANKFEQIVAAAWERRGYSTDLTSRGPDRGGDVIARNEDETVIIEAKCYSSGNKVGSPIIQKTMGAVQLYDADRAAVVTSSQFTFPARAVAGDLDVEIVNGEELAEWLATDGGE